MADTAAEAAQALAESSLINVVEPKKKPSCRASGDIRTDGKKSARWIGRSNHHI